MKASCAVVVVILNWHTPELAERCVQSVLDSRFPSGRMRLLVVDNNSQDSSPDLLRARFGDKVEVIETATNRGYAGGMNVGLSRAKELDANYAFLLNADIEVDKNAVEELYGAAEASPGGALFGTRIYDIGKPTDRWFVGGRWDWAQGTIRIVRENIRDGLSDEPRQIEFVNGAAMFVRTSALERVGMFDERFGLCFEESDLCSRAARMGYTLWHVPRAAVWHACGASTTKASQAVQMDIGQYYRTRNRLLWGRKNLTGLRAAAFWVHIAVRWPFKLVALLLSGRASRASGFIVGVYDFLRGSYGMMATDSQVSTRVLRSG